MKGLITNLILVAGLLILIVQITVADVATYNDNIVQIESGSIRGLEEKTIIDGKKFYSFRGIPYAKPPTGERRFKVCSYS